MICPKCKKKFIISDLQERFDSLMENHEEELKNRTFAGDWDDEIDIESEDNDELTCPHCDQTFEFALMVHSVGFLEETIENEVVVPTFGNVTGSQSCEHNFVQVGAGINGITCQCTKCGRRENF